MDESIELQDGALWANHARTVVLGVGTYDGGYADAYKNDEERRQHCEVTLQTEADVFAFLQLPYCPPHERHA
eukprot:SAG31_NODE_12738_length_919_cov_1.095006_1_plen_72_part_00